MVGRKRTRPYRYEGMCWGSDQITYDECEGNVLKVVKEILQAKILTWPQGGFYLIKREGVPFEMAAYGIFTSRKWRISRFRDMSVRLKDPERETR